MARLRQGGHDDVADDWNAPATAATPATAAAAGYPAGASAGMVGVLRRRRWLRRSLSFASVAIMLVAVGMIGYLWSITNLLRRPAPGPAGATSSPATKPAPGLPVDRNVQEGDSLTRIQIPAIDVDVVVKSRASAPARLRAGAGHYLEHAAALRGRQRGHRRPPQPPTAARSTTSTCSSPATRSSSPRPIGRLQVHGGSEQTIVRPSERQVVQNQGDNRLTLTTCHPKAPARQRKLVISATLVGPVDPPA